MILDESGFRMGKLPFRNMEVPNCHKRIAAKECISLINKMTTFIRVSSYQGRLLLVNSVSMSIHVYWDQVFI